MTSNIKQDKNSLKVLLVSLSNNADHQDTLFGLYEELLDKKGIDVYLLAIKEPKVALKKSNYTWLVDCPKNPGVERKTFDLFTLYKIIRRIRIENFDFIYFESLHVWNIPIMMFIGKKTKKLHVIHEVIPHEGDSHVKGVDFMNKLICKLSDVVILRNQMYRKELISRYQIDASRVKFLELWRRFPPFTSPVHNKHVLFFGRINPYKGADNLLKIVRQCPDIEFDVIGRVDPQMESIVDSLKLEKNVHLLSGYVSDEDMKNSFINCDWVIVPYNSASQSGVIIDAYKYSRPIIAFNVGAISEQVLVGKSGYLINPGDIKAFSAQLQSAIRMPTNQYDKMCSNAYSFGEYKYSTSGAVNRFCDLLNDVLTDNC